MLVKLIDTLNIQLADELILQINHSLQMNIAVAFARESGYQIIKKPLNKFLERNGHANFILGLDFQTTEPRVLQELYELSNQGYSLNLICYRGNLERTATYHPKMYLFHQKDNNFTAIIGSSNLTYGWLVSNIEANLEISSPSEELISDMTETFLKLKVSEQKIIPNSDYINAYSELYKKLKKKEPSIEDKELSRLIEIEKNLQKPKINANDLFWWKKIVFEKIPDHVFSARDMYKYEEEFKEIYPDNQNIKAKIRQQLQYLERLSYIQKIARDQWKKK